MAVLLKDGPKNGGHGKNKACVGNIWECSPLLSKPQKGGALPATGACTRLAGVIDQFLFAF